VLIKSNAHVDQLGIIDANYWIDYAPLVLMKPNGIYNPLWIDYASSVLVKPKGIYNFVLD
jgi:hypothetical protein